MGRRPVPIGVALADADERAITHIHRDDDALPRLRGDGPFAEDHMLDVDVVVDRLPGVDGRKPEPLEDDAPDCAAVEHGVLLAEVHIVDVVLEVLALEMRDGVL